jgi:chemotaxis protein MotB
MGLVVNKKALLLVGLAALILLPGCTNWKKKYQALEVEHKNAKGLLDRERAEKGQLAEQVTASQQTIEELQKQIEQMKKSPAEASGFGPGYDVKFDAQAGTVTVTLPNSILFDSGKANLKKGQINELDHITSVLQQQYAGRSVDVVGHTDSDPIKKSTWKDNWELSSERALSVTRYLVEKGMTADKVRAVGCGESRPLAPNDSAANKAKNRRVEIVAHLK